MRIITIILVALLALLLISCTDYDAYCKEIGNELSYADITPGLGCSLFDSFTCYNTDKYTGKIRIDGHYNCEFVKTHLKNKTS